MKTPDSEFHSGHKTFDKKAAYGGEIFQGNATTPVQYSSYLRPHSQVMNGSYQMKPGQGRDFDFNTFRAYHVPPRIREYIFALDHREEQLVLYVFRHKVGERITVHGWVLTKGGEDHELVMTIPQGRGKSYEVTRLAAEFVTGDQSPYWAGRVYEANEEDKIHVRYKDNPAKLAIALEAWGKAHAIKPRYALTPTTAEELRKAGEKTCDTP